MEQLKIAKELERNKLCIQHLLQGKTSQHYTWKASPQEWSLLEIICHLYDEERDDFRARVKHTLFSPAATMPSIDPVGWVTQRHYSEQNYEEKILAFVKERQISIDWLRSLENPNWENTHDHPVFGAVSAKMFLENWLAHDYLHLRQIVKVDYLFLRASSKGDFRYAGDW